MAKKILIIDDDNFMCEVLKKHLQNNDYQVETAFSAKSAFDLLKSMSFDMVLCDFRLPDSSGLEVMQKLEALNWNIPVVIMTAYADVRMAVRLMKMGAADYITKPIQHEELIGIIKNILQTNRSAEVKNTTSVGKVDFVVGENERMQSIIDLAKRVAPTNMSVIIEGETGTGKEYIARYIHENSLRKDKPFVAIDCGAIPKELANSELFGHVKGSFTGAISDKDGVFQKADGGTLFLDEIGNLSYEIQLKFLRAIQERMVARIGDDRAKKVDIRVIAATNENLQGEVRENSFREDLYHRLNEFKIALPPLRERGRDILIFVNHFIRIANNDLKKNIQGITPEVENIILNYPWHGNLRELKNVIKRSVLMANGSMIEKYCLPYEIIYPEEEAMESFVTVAESANNSLLKNAAFEIERQLIVKTIQEAGYNKSKAAKILNIDRKTLYNKIKLYGINL